MDVQIACPCTPKANGTPRHLSDTVTLRDKLDFLSATTIRKAITIVKAEDPGAGAAEVLGAMSEHYLLSGIVAWTLTDDRGQRIEVSRTTIRWVLEHLDPESAMDLTDAADGIYSEAVLLPLVTRASRLSPPTLTDESTSPTTDSGSEDQTEPLSGSEPPKSPKPSKRSSTSASRMGGTGTITRLPVGASSSSPRLASAR